MDKSISKYCGFDNLISQISEGYDIGEWEMSRAEYMEKARAEMFKEMEHWIIDAHRSDQEMFEDSMPELVKSVKIHFYQKDFMGNQWTHKIKIPIKNQAIFVGQLVKIYLEKEYKYNTKNGDWFKYISVVDGDD